MSGVGGGDFGGGFGGAGGGAGCVAVTFCAVRVISSCAASASLISTAVTRIGSGGSVVGCVAAAVVSVVSGVVSCCMGGVCAGCVYRGCSVTMCAREFGYSVVLLVIIRYFKWCTCLG